MAMKASGFQSQVIISSIGVMRKTAINGEPMDTRPDTGSFIFVTHTKMKVNMNWLDAGSFRSNCI
jgi:hypothetical protein